MREKAAIVESVHEVDLRELTALEAKVCQGDEHKWRQAEIVATLLESMTLRGLAEKWLNAKTGEPYDHKHVHFVSKVWKDFGDLSPQDRPWFNDAYQEVKKNSKVGDLHSSESNEWYTPPEYLEAVRAVMGGIDLDPASSELANQNVKAATYFTSEDDGLQHDWPGKVFCNPPYGGLQADFTAHLLGQYAKKITTEAILLVNSNSTETEWFSPLWSLTLCFVQGRINYINPAGNTSTSTHGSVFIYMGDNRHRFREIFSAFGPVVRTWNP